MELILENLTSRQLAGMFDHTLLKADASTEDLAVLCADSIRYGFKMVAINSVQTTLCRRILDGTAVHVGAAIGFPLGQTTIECKAFEARNAIENGADEIDYVINISQVKNKDYDYITREMQTIVDLCRKHSVISKVIFENCYLTQDEKIRLCQVAHCVKPDFIKTSTGFGTGGATIEDVRLMKSAVGEEIQVKAAGGIRDLDTCLAMIEAGATRIGTSSSIQLVESFQTKFESK